MHCMERQVAMLLFQRYEVQLIKQYWLLYLINPLRLISLQISYSAIKIKLLVNYYKVDKAICPAP